jgi:hypothetical protein
MQIPTTPVRLAAALLALCMLVALGCGPRYGRVVVRDQDGLKALLRAELRGGEAVDRGFSHPATIAGVRLAHVLSRIDVRLSPGEEGGERRPAIATELIYPLGDLLSEALAKANPSQEVVIQAIRQERRFGLFSQDYHTSFVAYVRGDTLFLHLSRVDAFVGKGEEKDLREPFVGREVMAFRVLASEGITPVGSQAVSVDWRDPIFRAPTHVRVGPTGRVMRRTILMESPPDDMGEERELLLPSDPDVLRALAELEEARRRGELSETEYHQRRGELMRSGGEGP